VIAEELESRTATGQSWWLFVSCGKILQKIFKTILTLCNRDTRCIIRRTIAFRALQRTNREFLKVILVLTLLIAASYHCNLSILCMY